MLGTSLPALIFIRICIVGLSSVAPISIAYTVYALYTRKHLVPCPVEFYFAAEAAFYFLWYLPWKHVLQKARVLLRSRPEAATANTVSSPSLTPPPTPPRNAAPSSSNASPPSNTRTTTSRAGSTARPGSPSSARTWVSSSPGAS